VKLVSLNHDVSTFFKASLRPITRVSQFSPTFHAPGRLLTSSPRRHTALNLPPMSGLPRRSLPALPRGAGLLYVTDGLWRVTGQNQRASHVPNHHVVLDPDAQAAETLRHLVVVLADVQPCGRRRRKWNNVKH